MREGQGMKDGKAEDKERKVRKRGEEGNDEAERTRKVKLLQNRG